ncbi:MAG: alpha-2-macroglobulin family protein [Deltaproteobacteria bacterium]|nr:alpha-2-macroglobulin family protein [Deltaproteobacteria bacterium]
MRKIALLAVLGVSAAFCSGPAAKKSRIAGAAADGGVAVEAPGVSFKEEGVPEGLRMRLREAGARSEAAARAVVAKGESLSQERIDKLLSRVPLLASNAGDKQAFALRPGSAPPPLSGKDVKESFPPPPSVPAPDEGKRGVLEVLRYAPEGEVPLAPSLSVTFSRPMVAVTSQDVASKTVPASLTPLPEGKWRWLGTRTVVFEPKGRFPMATNYRAEVPAGTKSATGEALKKGLVFSFATPPLGLTTRYPESGPQRLEPIIFLGFDQRVAPEKLLPFVELRGEGETFGTRLATAGEVGEDEVVRAMSEAAGKERWIALKAETRLPKATNFTVTLKEGAPSAEGPRTTPGAQAFSFRTFDPLKVTRGHCGWSDACPPTSDWVVELNNPLDENAFDPMTVKVEPEVKGLAVTQSGSAIYMSGLKQGRTAYTVTLPAGLKDTFGQTLGQGTDVEFQVGPAERTLFGPGKDLVTLDPAGPASFPVWSTNHKRLRVRVHKVTPDDWPAWGAWMRKYRYDDANPGPMPGASAADKIVRVSGDKDKLAQTLVDLAPYLEKGHGQLLVWIEPTVQPKERWNRQEIIAWVQVTELGLSAFVDNEEMLAWVTRLADGKPVPGVDVTLAPKAQAGGTTDGSGLARLKVPSSPKGPQVLVARKGGDAAILPGQSGWWGDGPTWQHMEPRAEVRWFTFDDRGIYRPGEEARVKGWLRAFEPWKGGDVRGLEPRPARIAWTLRDPRGNDIGKGAADVSALGGFDVTLKLPKDVNLGTAWLRLDSEGALDVSGTSFEHGIKIQEFRRPEFEVKASADPGPYVLGTEAVVDVAATYYAGGGLPGAEVTWTAIPQVADYVPPDRGDYAFGPWSPWWRFERPGGNAGPVETLAGKTDPMGGHHLGIRFESMNPPRPMSVRAEATIMDVNRQAWTASTTLLVHPSSLYVGVKIDRPFVGKGERVKAEAIVVDIDGKFVAGRDATLRMARLEWARVKGQWGELEVDPQECRLVSANGPKECTFEPGAGGTYELRAEVRDKEGRRNVTEVRLWVEGGEMPPSRDVTQEKVTLVPEKKEYRPGETARFLVQAPFFPAQGLLTVRRSGLVREERFAMDGPTKTFEVPILEAHVPDVTVQVDLVGSAPRADDQGRPQEGLARRVAYASGNLIFDVPPIARTLKVTAVPKDEIVEPGATTTVRVDIRDAEGKPVAGAEVALVAADESVLALTGYKLPNPLELFYAARGAGVSDHHQRDQVLLSDPLTLAAANRDLGVRGRGPGGGGMVFAQMAMPMAMPAPSPSGALEEGTADKLVERSHSGDMKRKMAKGDTGADAESGGEPGPAIAVRTDFSALALFAPAVKTDAAGKAEVELKVKDSLTRYRIMAVAVAGAKQFGSGESSVTARKPLMARPSPPRFLNFGDRFELPVVLQNQTAKAMDVEVALRAANLSPATAGQKVRVPANDRVEVRFDAAADMAGTARVQVVAASGAASDAATFELPVWTPATTEAFATYGEIDSGAMAQPVKAPPKVWTQFGGLEITTSSTQLQALTDAFVYLVSYPFDCNEQIASRILAIAALRDVLSAFDAEGLPAPAQLEASVASDMKRLAARQNWDGGFAFWRRGDEGWPYLTVHVAHALAMAKAKGYEVPGGMWDRTLGYLRVIEQHIPHWYSIEARWAIRGYTLLVRHRMGDTDAAGAAKLLDEVGLDNMPLDVCGWLLPVLAAGGKQDDVGLILRRLGNRVAETAAGAHFVTSYSDGAHVLLQSDRRADGVILDALTEVQPKSDLVPKLVRGLLDHRQKGRWGSTQENAFVLLALDRYFQAFEKVTPDFVARAWLGDGLAAEHAFKGRTTERVHVEIPMAYLAKERGNQRLVLAKDGPGRLYYRIGMRYAPEDLKLAAADYGFAVERTYESVDDESEVRRDADGTWRVKSGARVRVRLTMVAPMRRYHVALVDPLPAGLEPMNPDLAVTGTVPQDPSAQQGQGRWWFWQRSWYEHQNMRDERVEAFTSLLWDGVHSYTYVARATTPGTFVVPPTRAEEMYHPETFGRSSTDKLVVE